MAEEVVRHETGPSVVMNSATFNNGKHTYLVAGQESHCQLYHVRMSVEAEKRNSFTGNEGELRPFHNLLWYFLLVTRRNFLLFKCGEFALCSTADGQTPARQRKKRNSASENARKNSTAKEEDEQNQKPQSNGFSRTPKRLNFEIKPADSIQTDFRYVSS